ncbi:hypothetical protein A7982_13118 [Minicystis rosea]|nr:hypothetical protein A7982_13118 [Minicystis rosea]
MAVKKTRTTPSLTRVAARLKQDVGALRDAHQFADTVTREFLAERTNGKVTHTVTTTYAAWVHVTFGDDIERYTHFLEQVLAAHKHQGTTLFGWDEPPVATPSAEAERLLDRIDLGLHFIQRRLKIKLPPILLAANDGSFSIRNGAKAYDVLTRVSAFVDAASDLFG